MHKGKKSQLLTTVAVICTLSGSVYDASFPDCSEKDFPRRLGWTPQKQNQTRQKEAVRILGSLQLSQPLWDPAAAAAPAIAPPLRPLDVGILSRLATEKCGLFIRTKS